MAEAVVSFAVERLGDLLISEAKFLSGVKDKILEIQRQLKEMQDFLKDADNKRGNHQVGRWVAEIRELALQTEDVLETYAVKVASRREGGHMKKIMRRFACIIGECIALDEIGSEIGTIQANITNLATRREKLGIQALHDQLVEISKEEEAERGQQRITYGHSPVNDFVGMKDEIKELVSHLIKEDTGCEVVSVLGMGGQGKTTLVRKVFHHLKDEDNKDGRFKAFAWVCITQKLERKEALQNILQGLLPKMPKAEITAMGDPILVEELFKTLKNLKCLVVIDDIWSKTHWDLLKDAFPINDETSSSKILLTTRDETVADIGSPYKLRSLTPEEGLELFFKKVSPRRDDEIKLREEREKLGKEMVDQCQGLPLAISVLGGILKDKNWPNEWDEVKQNIDSNLSRGKGIANVRYILGLSYEYLPFRLKQLFLYLGTFKEDEEIDCDQLYLLWIAEGMVRSDQKIKREMLMDVAERYLVELAQRSLIQLELNEDFRKFTRVPWLKVRSCHLHDLIRDLCLSEGIKEDFLKKIDLRDAHNDDVVNGMKARRLAIYVNDDADKIVNIALEQHMVGQLRSLLFFKRLFEQNISNLKDFKLVRVLKLDLLTITKSELSRGITELIHLRYLSLRGCELEELPSCIGDLRYLETLDLSWVKGNPIIPDVLWKMKRLKHLDLPHKIGEVNKKLRFEGLEELELLANFDASKCDGNDLKKLTNLQVLLDAGTNTLQEQAGMMEFLNSDSFRPRYTSLQIGGKLDLIQLIVCQKLNELRIEQGGICMIPRRDEPPRLSQSLASIVLRYCNIIEAEALVLLGKLPNLQNLTLLYSSIAGNFVCTAKSFPELVHLHLNNVENLENWTVDDGAMPKLFDLVIYDCMNLEMFPEGLKYLTSLQELQILGMPKAFNDRVREGGQDIHKVDHIRNILIGPDLR